MGREVVIIGGGLGGLECGLILQRNGYNVTILERNARPGGCLQSFSRGGLSFDTGFHYAGGLGVGEPLHTLFEYFGLTGLPWRQLDPDCADEIVIDGKSFPMATGYDRFVDRLADFFPSERESLREHVAFLKGVGEGIFSAFVSGSVNPLFERSASEYLDSRFKDPLLRRVLCGPSLRLEMTPELPLYVFAQISNSFIQSSWRLPGGGSLIASTLADQLVAAGGKILTGTEVTSIHTVDGLVDHVSANGGEFKADIVVSDAHPAVTVGMVEPQESLRKVYRERISGLGNTWGAFTANIVLKEDKLDYLNRNIFIHEGGKEVMVHFYPVPEGSRATHLDLITPMEYIPREDPGYQAAKQAKLEECLALAASRFPGLRDAIREVYTSTPATYRRYTLTPQGSAFGIRKVCTNVAATVLSPRTPVRNLYLTGQSLNLHGLLGVSMTSILTCREILGTLPSILTHFHA